MNATRLVEIWISCWIQQGGIRLVAFNKMNIMTSCWMQQQDVLLTSCWHLVQHDVLLNATRRVEIWISCGLQQGGIRLVAFNKMNMRLEIEIQWHSKCNRLSLVEEESFDLLHSIEIWISWHLVECNKSNASSSTRGSLLHLECHWISISNLNLLGLFFNKTWYKRQPIAFGVLLNLNLQSQSPWTPCQWNVVKETYRTRWSIEIWERRNDNPMVWGGYG